MIFSFLFAALLFFYLQRTSFLFAAFLFFICSVPLFYLQRSFFYICSGSLFCLQRFFFVCSVSLVGHRSKSMAEKYEPTDFDPIQVSEPKTPVEEMIKEEFTYRSSAIFKNTSSHVNISCRSEILYRSHVIASYFQTGPM